MKRTKPLAAAMAAAILAVGPASLAQEQGSHDSHHPAQGSEAQPDAGGAQLPAQNDQSGMMDMMRMMDMRMMNMRMTNMAQMMQMMGGGGIAGPAGTGMERMDPAGMAMISHVEGRIAFLRAELKITAAQADTWDAFASALRQNAQRLDEARKADGGAASAWTLEQRLAAQEQWLSARLEGVRAIKGAFGHLSMAWSPDQQNTADELLPMHLGLMPVSANPMGMMPMGGGSQ